MFPPDANRQIAQLRFRLGLILVVRQCLGSFFIWIMIWATGTVMLRAVFLVDRWALLWGAVGLLVAAAVGTVLALRRLPSTAALRAALDRHGGCGGLLMAAGDTDIGPWKQQIMAFPPAALHWQFGRPCMLLLAALVFLAAAFLAPDRSLPLDGRRSLRIGGEIEKLSEQLDVLKEEEILPPEEAAVLEQDLEQVQEEALGRDPAKTLETMDHVGHSFRQAAADAAESVIRETEAAGHLQELAGALQAAESEMSPTQFGDAMKELTRMLEGAAAESNMLAQELSGELAEACEDGCLTPGQLQALCQALKECKAGQRARLKRLIAARLVDADTLSICDKLGECDAEALLAALCEGKSCEEALACSLPGRGGISRGRGDAAITWQDEVAQGDAGFKEKVLPPSTVASLKESRLASMSAAAPTVDESAGGSSGGALQTAQSGGGEAATQVILPEHARTVRRYFDRGKP